MRVPPAMAPLSGDTAVTRSLGRRKSMPAVVLGPVTWTAPPPVGQRYSPAAFVYAEALPERVETKTTGAPATGAPVTASVTMPRITPRRCMRKSMPAVAPGAIVAAPGGSGHGGISQLTRTLGYAICR